jgi:alcohol dehydrogenase
MKVSESSQKSAVEFRISKLETMFLFPVSPLVGNAPTAKKECTLIAKMEGDGFWEIQLMEPKLNTFAFPLPIIASIPIPAGADEEALVMLSDILPTGFECGVLNGQVKPGDNVAIVGGGPIGLAALLTAQFYSPAEIIMVDVDDNRLEVAKKFGATTLINNSDGKAFEKIMELTNKRGVDVAIEAVGIPSTFDVCQAIVAAGGHIANIGVHGKPVQLNIDKLWSHNITLTTRLVDTVTTPMLFKTVMSGKLQPKKLITHRFKLDDVMQAYKTFGNAMEERTLKVIITND